jgi:hypothetical protein
MTGSFVILTGMSHISTLFIGEIVPHINGTFSGERAAHTYLAWVLENCASGSGTWFPG